MDEKGRKISSKAVKRGTLPREVQRFSAKVIGMEAGGGAHYWARRFEAEGFQVKLMAPQYVRAYRRGPSKDDVVDAAAVAEAASRPNIPTVSVKQPWQQDLQCLHRIRDDLVARRTALCNQYRGFLLEFGMAPNQGYEPLLSEVQRIIREDDPSVPPMLRRALPRFVSEYHRIDADLELATGELERVAKENEACQRLVEIPGFGALSATAFVAAFGAGTFLRNGRQASAYLGLTPRRIGSGGKSTDLGITKHGDAYVRRLLIHGGRALVSAAKRCPEKAQPRVIKLLASKHACQVSVALANRNARIAYQLLKTGERYDPKQH